MRDRLNNSKAAVERLNGRIGRLGPGPAAARFRRHLPMIHSLRSQHLREKLLLSRCPINS
jgi:hypothetical protein